MVRDAGGNYAAAGPRSRKWFALSRVEINIPLAQSEPPFHFPIRPQRHFPTLVIQIDDINIQPASKVGRSIRSEQGFRSIRPEESIGQCARSKAGGQPIADLN